MRPTKVGAIKSVVALVVYDASRLLPSFFFRVDFGACEFINICFVSDKMILYAALFGVFFYLFVPLFLGFYICLYPYRHIGAFFSHIENERITVTIVRAESLRKVSCLHDKLACISTHYRERHSSI